MPVIRIIEFDTWRPGYGHATVRVLRAGTSNLADVFLDEAMDNPADNPQTLLERVEGGISYGKFSAPLYTDEPYYLEANSVDQTGVTRPALTDLVGIEGDEALVTVTGGEQAFALEDHLARVIHVADFGQFKAVGEVGASASTNAVTLGLALGAGGARGAAFVEIPAGTYQITNVTLPAGVILRGSGRNATILQSLFAGNVVTAAASRCGLSRLTLDGNTLVVNSVGFYAENKDQIVLDDVEIKRFETGVLRKGGKFARWSEVFVSNCVNGVMLRGIAAQGGEVAFNSWTGGQVATCSTVGAQIEYVDQPTHHTVLQAIDFDTNTGTALRILGARETVLRDCRFVGNTINIAGDDVTPATVDNTIVGLQVEGGSIDGGTINLSGKLERVSFRGVTLNDVDVTLTTPTNNVLALDCREVADVIISGIATAWLRQKTNDGGASSGLTAGNAATKAWAITLDSGQRVFLEAKVIGRGRNVTDDAFYHISVAARRAGASLAYDTQTANFTAGAIVTGQTSGATARITADSDSGSTGTLTVQDIAGTFVDNETVTDANGGSATVNGAISTSSAALVGSVTNLATAQETDSDFAATFVANGPEIELRVTGDTSKTVEWTVDVQVTSS